MSGSSKCVRLKAEVATCDPYDCGVNSVYVDDARRGSKTCLYLDAGLKQNLVQPARAGMLRRYVGIEFLQQGFHDMRSLFPLLQLRNRGH